MDPISVAFFTAIVLAVLMMIPVSCSIQEPPETSTPPTSQEHQQYYEPEQKTAILIDPETGKSYIIIYPED